MTTLIFIRHCEAYGNLMRVFQGHTDAPISDRGARQLESLSRRFAGVPFDAIYSSPLQRARQTAEAANKTHRLPLQIEPGLIEINGGAWEGKKWADLPVLYPEAYENWSIAPYRFQAPEGESMRQVYDRVWKAALSIVERNPDKQVVCVSHGCALRNLLCRAMGKPIEELNTVDWCDTTAVSILRFHKNRTVSVVLQNDNSHLADGLSTFAEQTWHLPENRNKIIVDE